MQEADKDIVEIAKELEATITSSEDKTQFEKISLIEKEIDNILKTLQNLPTWRGNELHGLFLVIESINKTENRALIDKALDRMALKNSDFLTDFFTEFGEYGSHNQLYRILAWLGMAYWVGVVWYGLANGFSEEAFFWSLDWIGETGMLAVILLPCALGAALYGLLGWFVFFGALVKVLRDRRNLKN